MRLHKGDKRPAAQLVHPPPDAQLCGSDQCDKDIAQNTITKEAHAGAH